MQLSILNTRQVKKLRGLITEQFGIKKLPDLVFLMNQRNRVFVTNRSLEDIDTEKLNLERIGMYFGELRNNEFRLGIEGSQLVGKLATRNMAELTDEQAKAWLRGEDVEFEGGENHFVIVKHNQDFMGCARHTQGILFNFVPKTRRSKVII